MRDMASVFLWVVVLLLFPGRENASGLVIYRLGGEEFPLPPEAGEQDVDFVQLGWLEVEEAQGGELYQLDMDTLGIRALEYDPQVNIAPTAEDRGGKPILPALNGEVWDGDINTVWNATRYLCIEFRGTAGHQCREGFAQSGTTQIILGDGTMVLDRVRILSGLNDPAGVARTVRLFISSLANMPFMSSHSHPPLSPYIVEVHNNNDPYLEIPLPPHEDGTFLQVALGEHDHPWKVHDIEVYAKGFVERSTYISNRIDAQKPVAWGQLRWAGRKASGAKVFIQTRSGAGEDPLRYWKFIGNESEKVEVTRSQYNRLKPGEQGGTTYNREDWTFWSAPYDFADSAGTAISASPDRFFQFKVDFFPGTDGGGELDFLELHAASPPLASELVAEIYPFEVEPGETTRFTYALRPVIGDGDIGFDRLKLTSSSNRIMSVETVRLGGVDVDFAVERQTEEEVVIALPAVEREDTAVLIEVVFEAIALRYGSTFDARVFSSRRPLEVPQGVLPGDATDASAGDRVSVITSIKDKIRLRAEAAPPVFTPNGDQINDGFHITYDLFELSGSGSVTVEIRDLTGRLVRQVYAGDDPVGHYRRAWDGKDQAGRLVRPGVYLYRVSVDTDEGKTDKIGTLHVAY